MANEKIHNSTTLPLITDKLKSVNVFDGPWDSIDAFTEWWNGATRNRPIPAGTVIGVTEGTNVGKWCWIVPEGSSGYWKNLDYVNSVIEFAGVVSDITITLQTYSAEGSRATVFYDEATGTFVVKSGSKYYSAWQNGYSYGAIDGGRIYPHEGKLYVDISTGQVFYATSNELEPAPGGSIDSELLAELQKLKAMNIRFNDGVLTMYDATANRDKQYNLDEQVVVSYGTPSISFGYGTITSNGGTYSPDENNRLIVTQDVYHNGSLYDTLTYQTVTSLKNAATSVGFTVSGTGFSVNSSTGILTVQANSGSSERTGSVTLGVVLNGVQAAATIELTQPAASVTTLTASEIIYDTTSVVGSTYSSAPKIKGNNGTTYASLSAFNQAGGETLTFSCASLYGASVNSSTGVISYNPSTVLNAFVADVDNIVDSSGIAKRPSITVGAGNATGSYTFAFDNVITTSLDTTFGVRIEQSTSKLVTGKAQGKTAWSFEATADNIYCFRIAHSGSDKTPCILLLSDTALVTENSVNTTDVVYGGGSSIYVSDFYDDSFIYKASANKYVTVVLMWATANTGLYMFDGGTNE